jgi:hypothetical protein
MSSGNNVIKFVPPPPDFLCEASTGLATGSTAAPQATLVSTMVFSGRTSANVPPNEYRKYRRRICYMAIDALFPLGVPIELQLQDATDEIEGYCLERGLPKASTKTIHRAIRDRYRST